jgi:S1-C subfamily serine protease
MSSDAGGGGRFERTATIAAIVMLAAALAASEASRFAASQKATALEARVATAETEAQSALKAVIAPEIIADVDKSVYMVLTKDGYVGTAFVIDRDRGVLATAAHVASALKLSADKKIAVVNRTSKRPLPVIGVKIHSGYGAFKVIAEEYQPFRPDSPALNPEIVALHDLANDAALLLVDPIDSKSGENLLGPSMKIAGEDELLALAPGDAIASVGFPVDVITVSGTPDVSASSRGERGTIAAMIAPIDAVEDAGDRRAQNLIVHRMATAPGSSGGPLVNAKGEVIGITSHGFDSPLSNGDSVAQRAEVLFDMLEPLREEEMVARYYAPLWKKRLERWLRAKDILPFTVYALNVKGAVKKPEATLKDVDFSADMPFDQTLRDARFGPVTRSFVVPATDLPGAAKTEALSAKISARASPSFTFNSTGEYATATIPLPRNRSHAVFAFDYAVTYAPDGFCALDLYHRKIGEPTMSALRARALPIFAVKNEGVEGSTVHQFVFRRAPCEGAAPEFFYGVVSWDEPAAAKAVTTAALLQPPPSDAPVKDQLLHAAAATENFANCNVKILNRTDRCIQIIKASEPG